MQADRVFLHVGHAKTGTTTVQRSFRESHRLLADNGVLYSRAFIAHRRLRDFIRGDKKALAMERGFRRELRTLRHRRWCSAACTFWKPSRGRRSASPKRRARRITHAARLDLDYLEWEWGMTLHPPPAPAPSSSVEEPVLSAETARAIADGFVALAKLQEKSARKSELSWMRRCRQFVARRLLAAGRGRSSRPTAAAAADGTAAGGTLSPGPGSSTAP